jgi:hypothetical protein
MDPDEAIFRVANKMGGRIAYETESDRFIYVQCG